MSSWNSSRSRLMPSANGRFTAASTALMQFSGARKPRVWRATLFLNSAKISGLPRAGAILSSRSRIFFSTLLVQRLLGERDAGGREVAVHDLVDQADPESLVGADRITAH